MTGNPAIRQHVWSSGMSRLCSPEETLAWIRPYFPIMGITRIADVTGLDRIGIPVVLATRPNARSISVSQGKGLTLTAAKVSAAMESIETWHGENITHPIRYSDYEDLRYANPVADVHRLPLSAHGPFDGLERMAWIEAQDLTDGAPWLVSFELVNADYSEPALPGAGNFFATTNGLASGNSRAEAILQALYEVVERDAMALWTVMDDETVRARAIDPGTIQDKTVQSLLARFDAAGLNVAIWDVTSDIGIPVFACLLHGRPDDTRGDEVPEMGAGAHVSPQVALIRALTEAAQVRLTFISGSRDDVHLDAYGGDALSARIEWGRQMAAQAEGASGNFAAIPDRSNDGPEADMETVRARLAANGCDQILVADLTKREMGIPVIRVIVPGLEGPRDGDTVDCLPGVRLQEAYLAGAGKGRP